MFKVGRNRCIILFDHSLPNNLHNVLHLTQNITRDGKDSTNARSHQELVSELWDAWLLIIYHQSLHSFFHDVHITVSTIHTKYYGFVSWCSFRRVLCVPTESDVKHQISTARSGCVLEFDDNRRNCPRVELRS